MPPDGHARGCPHPSSAWETVSLGRGGSPCRRPHRLIGDSTVTSISAVGILIASSGWGGCSTPGLFLLPLLCPFWGSTAIVVGQRKGRSPSVKTWCARCGGSVQRERQFGDDFLMNRTY
ncbi:hypothetical protein ACQJBY_015646 [Aegilops geniculata]